MACPIISGITKTCRYSLAGVEEVLITNKGDITDITYAADGTVTAISGGTWYLFEFEDYTGQMTQNIQKAANTNILQTVNGVVGNYTQEIRNVISTVGLANMTAIVKDNAGLYWLVGQDGVGLIAQTNDTDTGTVAGDQSGVVMSLQGNALDYAPEVDSSIIAGLPM